MLHSLQLMPLCIQGDLLVRWDSGMLYGLVKSSLSERRLDLQGLSRTFLVPAGELAVLWCVEPIGVAVAATIDEGSALATSSVVVPPQGVPGTVSLVQGKQARVCSSQSICKELEEHEIYLWRFKLK